MRTLLLSALLAAAASHAAPPVIDTARVAQVAFGNDAPWYRANIPFLDTPDARLNRVYFYRWQLFRSHMRDIGAQGTVFTEFLPEVGWDRKPYSTLNDSAAFPLLEGRWLRDPRPVDSFIDYLYADAGNDRHFSEAIADAAWQRYRVTGDPAPLVRNPNGPWNSSGDSRCAQACAYSGLSSGSPAYHGMYPASSRPRMKSP